MAAAKALLVQQERSSRCLPHTFGRRGPGRAKDNAVCAKAATHEELAAVEQAELGLTHADAGGILASSGSRRACWRSRSPTTTTPPCGRSGPAEARRAVVQSAAPLRGGVRRRTGRRRDRPGTRCPPRRLRTGMRPRPSAARRCARRRRCSRSTLQRRRNNRRPELALNEAMESWPARQRRPRWPGREPPHTRGHDAGDSPNGTADVGSRDRPARIGRADLNAHPRPPRPPVPHRNRRSSLPGPGGIGNVGGNATAFEHFSAEHFGVAPRGIRSPGCRIELVQDQRLFRASAVPERAMGHTPPGSSATAARPQGLARGSGGTRSASPSPGATRVARGSRSRKTSAAPPPPVLARPAGRGARYDHHLISAW